MSTDDPRRSRVLEAALGVFLRYGFRKTSMDEVARAADLSRQGLYLQFATKEFSAQATHGEQSIAVAFNGNADMRAVPGLEEFIPNIHAQARRMKVDEVAVDMGGLEFMNSSCFLVFVNWLNWFRELPAADRYFVRFLAATGRHWQRPSLSALACFAVDIVKVDNIDVDTNR